MLKTQRSADIASGCFLAVLGLVVLFAATKITGGMEERLPPRTLPYILGLTVLLAGAALAVRAWRFRGENPAIPWPNRGATLRILISLWSLGVYVALISSLGMSISTTLFISFLVWYLRRGRHRILVALITGLLCGAVVHLLFIQFLELSFPVGPLPR